MDSPTTVMLMTPNCSSLFPYHPPTPMLWHASLNVWQTSQLHITSYSTLVKLNSCPSHPGERLPSHGPVSHCWGCYGIAFVDGKLPWRNPRWWIVLCPQHHCCGRIRQICPLQHLQDPFFPYKRHNASPGLSTGHLLPGLLLFGWTPSLCD